MSNSKTTYKILTTDDFRLILSKNGAEVHEHCFIEDALDMIAVDGWELCAVYGYKYYLKRTIITINKEDLTQRL